MATVSWDDDSVARKRDNRVKFKKDKVDRCCILDQDAAMKWVHYRGTYVECTAMQLVDDVDGNTGKPTKAWKAVNPCRFCENPERPGREPEERFAAHIIMYGTDQDGMPLSPLTFALKYWSFAKDKFGILRMYRKQFGDVRTRDIIFTCTNEQYQHLTLTPAAEAWWLMDERFKVLVSEKYRASKFDLDKEIATLVPYDKQLEYLQKQAERQAKYDQNNNGGHNNSNNQQRGQQRNSLPFPQGVVVSGGSLPSFGSPPQAPPQGSAMPPMAGLQLPPPPSSMSSLPSLPSPSSIPPQSNVPSMGFTPPSAPPNSGGMPDLSSLDAILGKIS